MKRDPREAKLLPMHHMLLPQDKVHYLQVSCRDCNGCTTLQPFLPHT